MSCLHRFSPFNLKNKQSQSTRFGSGTFQWLALPIYIIIYFYGFVNAIFYDICVIFSDFSYFLDAIDDFLERIHHGVTLRDLFHRTVKRLHASEAAHCRHSAHRKLGTLLSELIKLDQTAGVNEIGKATPHKLIEST